MTATRQESDHAATAELRAERELKQHNARHRITERRRVIQKLRQALATNRLALHFQPIIALASGRACAAEVQLRLDHSRRGLIPAGHLLPLAEQSDMIIDLGAWMLRQVCVQAAQMPRDFTLSLALCLRHLRSGQLVKHVLEALQHAQAEPCQLELLITEEMLLDANEDTVFALRALQGLGLRLALDHFGTGYASLAPLRKLNFSTLRLDRSLVRDIEADGAAGIVQAAVEAGHALGCQVLADGVESQTQYDLLRRLRADLAQGSFFSAALDGAALGSLLARR